MEKKKSLYLLGKTIEEGVAYAMATVVDSGEEHEAVLLFESPYDAYLTCKEKFNNDTDMTIFETTLESIEKIETETMFVFVEKSEQALEKEAQKESEKKLMC